MENQLRSFCILSHASKLICFVSQSWIFLLRIVWTAQEKWKTQGHKQIRCILFWSSPETSSYDGSPASLAVGSFLWSCVGWRWAAEWLNKESCAALALCSICAVTSLAREPHHIRGDQRTGTGVRTKLFSLELKLENLCWLPAAHYLHHMVQPVWQKHLKQSTILELLFVLL